MVKLKTEVAARTRLSILYEERALFNMSVTLRRNYTSSVCRTEGCIAGHAYISHLQGVPSFKEISRLGEAGWEFTGIMSLLDAPSAEIKRIVEPPQPYSGFPSQVLIPDHPIEALRRMFFGRWPTSAILLDIEKTEAVEWLDYYVESFFPEEFDRYLELGTALVTNISEVEPIEPKGDTLPEAQVAISPTKTPAQ